LTSLDVYLEVGQKRVLAGALDWPGWCRGGRDEESALQALLDYGPRYAQVLHAAGIRFRAPDRVSDFIVGERLKGNATTDFGVPGLAPSADSEPVKPAQRKRLEKILQTCWQALDESFKAASGKPLRKGPRGGGRDLDDILRHVLEAEAGYLSQLGGKLPKEQIGEREPTRQAILETLAASARGEIPSRGPRGGLRWSPRYFVRRAAWHTLDHVWEIEDRTLSA
jgi:hypothetical protein